MYTPRSFRIEHLPTLHALIRDFSFGVLVSADGSSPVATHLPFMVDPDRGPLGTLIAHMARANRHWQSWTEETRVLTIFQGPHAYVSPGWYENQQTVPTWNHATVHAYGTPYLIREPSALRPMVEKLVDMHESHADSGWDRSMMKPEMATELQAIVGFEIPIDSIEGQFKFNQNRSREDQEGVAAVLEGSKLDLERETAKIMRRNMNDAS